MRLSCTICYELFIPSDDVHAAPCGHILHLNCWTGWLQRSENCPDCRKKTRLNQLIKLFFNIGEGDDYTTLSNKYDALRCDLSCKTKDCEVAETKLRIQTEEVHALRQQIQKIKAETEKLKKSGKFNVNGKTDIVELDKDTFLSLLESGKESATAIKRNKELAEEIGKLKKKAEELGKGKLKKKSDELTADIQTMKSCETIVRNLKKCLHDYEEIRKNSDFVKSLKAYTDQIEWTEMWGELEESPGKYVDLFRDVKKFLEQKEKREEELHQSPRGCVLELFGFPKTTTLQWRDVHAAIEQWSEMQIAFITFNPGDEIAYVRFVPEYYNEKPAVKFVNSLYGGQIIIADVTVTPRALQGQEEIVFLRKSLEDRDKRNRDRFRKRRGFNDDEDEDEESLLDQIMRMVAENPTKEEDFIDIFLGGVYVF